MFVICDNFLSCHLNIEDPITWSQQNMKRTALFEQKSNFLQCFLYEISQNIDILKRIHKMCFYGNQIAWGIKHPFISPWFKGEIFFQAVLVFFMPFTYIFCSALSSQRFHLPKIILWDRIWVYQLEFEKKIAISVWFYYKITTIFC